MKSFDLQELYLSVMLFVIAFLTTTIMHELSHAVVSLLFGYETKLYHVYIKHSPGTPQHDMLIALAGPSFSLLQGLFFLVIMRSQTLLSVVHLLMFWLAMLGLMNFSGYLLTTPFVPDGDFGRIAEYFKCSIAMKWLIFIIGLILITAVGYLGQFELTQIVYIPQEDKIKSIEQTVLFYGVIPWIIGATIVAFLSIPSPHSITYIYAFFTGSFLITAWLSEPFMNYTFRDVPSDVVPTTNLLFWLIITIIIVGIFRFLSKGVKLG